MNGSALVFDHGGRRIGVAVANLHPRLASPLVTLAARDGIPDWLELDRLVKEWRPGQLVVGVPYNDASRRIGGGGSSESSDSESAAERFATSLEGRYQLQVARIDERLTSVEAESRLREQRRSGTRTKKVRTGRCGCPRRLCDCGDVARPTRRKDLAHEQGSPRHHLLRRGGSSAADGSPRRPVHPAAAGAGVRPQRDAQAPSSTCSAHRTFRCAGPCRSSGPMPAQGWVEVLYKVVGRGLEALARAEPGSTGERPRTHRPGLPARSGPTVALLIGGGVGIPPLMFLAEVLAHSPGVRWEPRAFFGSELPFPFEIDTGSRHAAPAGQHAASRRSWPATPGCRAASAASSPTSPGSGSPASRRQPAPA